MLIGPQTGASTQNYLQTGIFVSVSKTVAGQNPRDAGNGATAASVLSAAAPTKLRLLRTYKRRPLKEAGHRDVARHVGCTRRATLAHALARRPLKPACSADPALVFQSAGPTFESWQAHGGKPMRRPRGGRQQQLQPNVPPAADPGATGWRIAITTGEVPTRGWSRRGSCCTVRSCPLALPSCALARSHGQAQGSDGGAAH